MVFRGEMGKRNEYFCLNCFRKRNSNRFVTKSKLQCWVWVSALFYSMILNINQSVSTLMKVDQLFPNKKKPTLTRSCTVMWYYSVLLMLLPKSRWGRESNSDQLPALTCSRFWVGLVGGWTEALFVLLIFKWSLIFFSWTGFILWIYAKIIFHKEASVYRLTIKCTEILQTMYKGLTAGGLPFFSQLYWLEVYFPF